MLIIGGSGSGKTNSLFNLIIEELHIDKIYLYAKDPYEAKYWFLIDKRESTGLKHFNGSKSFIEYSNDMEQFFKELFKEYSFNHTLLFLAKEFYNTNQNVNDEIVKHINDALIKLKKDINRKKILKMKIQIK